MECNFNILQLFFLSTQINIFHRSIQNISALQEPIYISVDRPKHVSTYEQEIPQILSDFINLTQVHNFTVSAQDIFTFRRLSVLP